MTNRERILAAIRGEVPDRLPWVPRLDFWYRAQTYLGTLPKELQGLTLIELADRLGVGAYAVVPDATECLTGTEMLDRALGIFQLPVIPYRVTFVGVERQVQKRDYETTVEYHTPLGSIRTRTVFTEEMLQAGVSVAHIAEHAIQKPRDFEVVGYIFSHLKVEPRLEGYLARREQIGDRGIVVGYISPAASPMHHIMKALMPLDQFSYAIHDCPAQVAGLAKQMEPFYRQIKKIAADSPAEVIHLGSNYDDAVTYPPFFAEHILPSIRDYAKELHRKGKYLMCHTDGESRRLLRLYLEAGFDVADSVCPYPMTSCRLDEIRATFGDRISIWGGIPATLLCAGSSSFEDCRRFVDDVLDRYRGQSHFILGVSDMVTAEADWSRLQYISEAVASTDWRARQRGDKTC